VRGTTGKFRNFGDEDLILVAPVDKDLVFSHDYLRLGLAATELMVRFLLELGLGLYSPEASEDLLFLGG
jgi:hypothetical protein